MDNMKLEEQLKELQVRRDEVFNRFQNDKSNPYWYEDWGCIIDDLDKQITTLKQKLSVKSIDEFVDSLASVPSTELVANPYRDEACRENLRDYLQHIQHVGFDVMLVGEAPGYKGCARTGIPFTDEFQLMDVGNEFALGAWERRMTEDVLPESAEETASNVWFAIRESGLVPLMWNIFPFHPHEESSAKGNRTPTPVELAEGLRFAEELIAMFGVDHDQIYAVGRKAQWQLNLDEGHYIRHPSHGGSELFAENFATKIIDRVS